MGQNKATREGMIDALLKNPDCTADAMLRMFTQHFGKAERGSEVDKALSPTYELAKMYFAYGLDKLREQEVSELQDKCEKYEAALTQIAENEGECCRRCEGNGKLWADGQAHLPSYGGPTVNCGNCGGSGRIHDDLQEIATEALSGDGEKVESAKHGIVRLLLSSAAEVSKDAESAKAYLESEGADMTTVKNNAHFVTWLAEFSKLLHEASSGQPVKINQEEARKWFDDGMTAYQCFRETWNME